MKTASGIELGLPPGLYLPLPSESTDQFLKGDFNCTTPPDPERFYDYSLFATALTFFGRADRVSHMPTQVDFSELSKEGYGVSPEPIARKLGGIASFQEAQGFYTRGTSIDEDSLTSRLLYLHTEVVPLVPELKELDSLKVSDLFDWATPRNLLPSIDSARKQVGSLASIGKTLQLSHRDVDSTSVKTELFRLGARIQEAGRSNVNRDSMRTVKLDGLNGSFGYLVERNFGSMQSFWREFDVIDCSRNMTPAEVVAMGVREAIARSDTGFVLQPIIEELSRRKAFVSIDLIVDRFGSISRYREIVEKEFSEYKVVEKTAVENGIDESLVVDMARLYEDNYQFSMKIGSLQPVLVELSSDSEVSKRFRYFVSTGLNLQDTEKYTVEAQEAVRLAISLCSMNRCSLFDVLSLIPRVDPLEVATLVQSINKKSQNPVLK